MQRPLSFRPLRGSPRRRSLRRRIVRTRKSAPRRPRHRGGHWPHRRVQAGACHGSFTDYVNLALKAGFGVGMRGADPLVPDLDGDGVELSRGDNAGVYFDGDSDGFAERTAWMKPDDGLLARDLNGNGKIDNIGELFGDATTSASPRPRRSTIRYFGASDTAAEAPVP